MIKINFVASIILVIALFATLCESTKKIGTNSNSVTRKCSAHKLAPVVNHLVKKMKCEETTCVGTLKSKFYVESEHCCVQGIPCLRLRCEDKRDWKTNYSVTPEWFAKC